MVGREELLAEPVRDVEVSPGMSVEELLEAYSSIHGFMAGHLARAVKILEEGLKARVRVISFTANLVATGLRGVIAQLIRERIFNLVVTTCGTVDHDVARGTGGKYYKGFFEADDEMLYSMDIHRLGNVYIPVEDYGPRVEKHVYRTLDGLGDGEYGIYEVLWRLGEGIEDRHSILRAAYETKTPVIVPGYLDGAFGTALYTYIQVHGRPRLNPFKDEDVMADAFFKQEGEAMALIIGGGISKHHTIWWAQFRGGLDYAVYITTAVEYDGSLSGAQPREAITWGKLKPGARRVVVYGDATIILPIIAAALLARKR